MVSKGRVGNKTELVKYRCPSCGHYNTPYFFDRKGHAFSLCEKCKAEYKTSTGTIANFRKFSSRQGKKPNRSPTYYSSSERTVKRYLEKYGLIENLDFFHNARVRDTNREKPVYFWLDFIIPSRKLVVECDPEVWHKLDGREESDKRKKDFIESLGWTFISLNNECIRKLNKSRKGKDRPEECKELDGIIAGGN